MTKKLTTADLMRELDALKKKVAELEARPARAVEHHHYYPSYPQYIPLAQPYRPYQPTTWPSPTITWSGSTGTTTSPPGTTWVSANNAASTGYVQTKGLAQSVAK